ncbi:MAG: radical SAM protein [Deltaproteobacteria bacterium]|nr:radical SAM protein [Deltaproteobacteria bacterium]
MLTRVFKRFTKPSKQNPNLDEVISGINLSWVDEFIENVRPYVFVRTEDNILIKRPNNAVKLNPSGAKFLKFLLEGHKLHELLRAVDSDVAKLKQLEEFLRAVRLHLENKLDPLVHMPAVEILPFDMSFSEYPVLSEIALTYRCNLRCKFCYAGCNCTTNPVGSKHELSSANIKKVIHKLFNDAKVPSVSFTGGEPTLVSELFDYISYAKTLGMRVNLITNGSRITEKYAQALKESGLDSAQVSVEGVNADTHNEIVQASSFAKSVAAVRHLREAGIFTHSNTTINRINLAECLEFPRFARDILGCNRFSMNLMIPTGSGELNDEMVVPYSEIGPYIERIRDESEKVGVEFMWYSPVPMCMFNSIVNGLGNKGCSACDGLISIGANGALLPCASYDENLGDFLSEDFSTLWKSSRSAQFRKKDLAHDACKKCEHFHICNGACPLYWRNQGYEELTKTLGDTN